MCIVSTYCAYWHLVDPCPCDQTMIMKMHSYMATSDYLQYVSQQSAETMTQLRDATVCVGGWEKVIYEAKQRREDLERETDIDTTSTSVSPSPFATLDLRGVGLSTSYAEVPSTTARYALPRLRQDLRPYRMTRSPRVQPPTSL